MFDGETDNGEKRFSLVGKVGRAFPEDEEELATFGYDTWGQGKPVATFVAEDLQSPDTLRGERWFFQVPSGEKVSVLNLLRFSRGVLGLASIATSPNHRGKGFAPLLIRAVMELVRIEDPATRFLLFAEARPEMYERLGFRALPDSDQHFRPVIAMMTDDSQPTPFEREIVRVYF
jgi:GNAT superfamily N-acetyltransferase